MTSGQLIGQHRARWYLLFASSRCTWELFIWGYFMLALWPEVFHTTQISRVYPETVISLWLHKFREVFLYIQERHIPYPSLFSGGQSFSPPSSLEVPALFKDFISNLGKIQILLSFPIHWNLPVIWSIIYMSGFYLPCLFLASGNFLYTLLQAQIVFGRGFAVFYPTLPTVMK